MRKELELMEIIDQYLTNEMNETDRKTFETRLENEPKLRELFEQQKALMKGLKRHQIRSKVKKAKKTYQAMKTLKTLLLGTAVILAAATAFYYFNNKGFTENILPELNESGEKIWSDADRFLKAQKFNIQNQDTLLYSKEGVVISIPENAFLDANGKVVEGPFDIEYKEALNPEDILKAGLSTKSGSNLLETGGMFYLNATKNGQQLYFNPDQKIMADVPTKDAKEDMQLFEGVRQADGSIDWQNPQPIINPLHPLDILKMDLYPPNYLDTVHSLGKDAKDKRYTDSLYYSYASLFGDNHGDMQMYFEDDAEASLDELLADTTVATEDAAETSNCSIELNAMCNHYNNRTLSEIKGGDFELKFITKGLEPLKNLNKRYAGKPVSYYQRAELEMKVKIKKGFKLVFANDQDNSDFARTWQWRNRNSRQNLGFYGFYTFNPSYSQTESPFAESNYSSVSRATVLSQNYEKASFNVSGSHSIDEILVFRDSFILKQSVLIPVIASEQVCPLGFLSMNLEVLPESVNDLGEEFNNIEFFVCENQPQGINPIKIKSIWDKRYNNTLLATQEFQNRLPYIHKSCDGNVLDMYVDCVDQNMYEIDKKVMQYLGLNHELYPVFKDFADKQQGTINIKDRALKKLNALYAKRQMAFQQAVDQTAAEHYKEMAQLDQQAKRKKTSQMMAEMNREDSNFRKEYEMNLKSVCEQLGIEKNGTIPEDVYRVTIADPGWKNIDRIVEEQTRKRETIHIVDEESGKEATVNYSKFEVLVKDKAEYDRVYAYLLPQQLKSFQRMKDSADWFKENLNELIDYQWCVVGYKGAQPYWHFGKRIPAGPVSVKLEKTKASKIRKTINANNSNEIKSEMIREFEFHEFEYEEAIRQNQIIGNKYLRKKVHETIFPCIDLEQIPGPAGQ
ncbi:MAG: hypothetical protein MRY83_12220 [Flavobacteriales bacterium]|nr:hypothetical protein [Flavobacteriales bacterium]